jgi:uncharacterized protein YrrD
MAILRLLDQFDNLPVRSLRTGHLVAHLQTPIIDPKNLRIVAWTCQADWSAAPLLLRSEDIRGTTDQAVIVDSEEELVEPDDLVRLKPVLELNFQLLGKPVVTDQKRKVGKVSNFVVEDESWFIQKLYVGQSILKNLGASGRVISRQQIVEITPHRIVVRDVDVKSAASELAKIVNPVVRPELVE